MPFVKENGVKYCSLSASKYWNRLWNIYEKKRWTLRYLINWIRNYMWILKHIRVDEIHFIRYIQTFFIHVNWWVFRPFYGWMFWQDKHMIDTTNIQDMRKRNNNKEMCCDRRKIIFLCSDILLHILEMTFFIWWK